MEKIQKNQVHTFLFSAAHTWISLPKIVRDSDSLVTFKSWLAKDILVLPCIQLTVAWPATSASEVTTLRQFRNLTIIIIFYFYFFKYLLLLFLLLLFCTIIIIYYLFNLFNIEFISINIINRNNSQCWLTCHQNTGNFSQYELSPLKPPIPVNTIRSIYSAWVQTNDDESLASTCQCHVNLMRVTYESHVS